MWRWYLYRFGVCREAQLASAKPSDLDANSVSWDAIGKATAGACGRVLVLLDACHAGHVSQDLVVPDGALVDQLMRTQRSSLLVFAAAKGSK